MLKKLDPDDDGDDDGVTPEREEMDDEALLAILKAEEYDATSYYTSELAKDQADAMDRYYAAPYGNEVDGRSKITTHDIEDTVNWMLPDLMRVFMSGDELVSCTPNSAGDEANTDLAAQYLEHVFFEDNPGATIIHDFAFDGLVQRVGIISVQWQEPQPRPPEVMEGVGQEQMAKLQADPEYEILEADDATQVIESPTGPVPMPAWNIKVKRTPKMGRVHIENVPPEEIALSRRSRAFPSRQRGTAQSAGYVRRKQERYLADIKREFPDKRDELDEMKADNVARVDDMDTDPRVLSRFQNESISVGTETSNHELRKKVDFYTEYLWIDYDQDDVVELRRILRVGDVILENLAVDDCEYKAWSPIRVAHKAIGRSIADTVVDMQRIRTTMMRLMLDSLSQSLVPRTKVNMQMVDEPGIDDLLDSEIGGVIRCKGDVRAAMEAIVSPDVSAPALQALEYVDQKSEQQSGVTRHSQGIAPQAITKTAAGIDMLQSAAGERIELVARWLGLALEDVLRRVLQLLVAHQDQLRWVKIKGKALDVDPRGWSEDMGVKVHVGAGGANRQTRIMNLATIAQKQEQAIQAGGPRNPVCDVTHLINTYGAMAQEMGFKDPKKFFNDPQQAQQLLAQSEAQPKQDPKMAEVQARAQASQAELQQKGQIAAQELQHKAQVAQAEQQARAQADVVKAQADQEAADRKARNDIIIAKMRQDAETQIARERMAAEIALKQEQMRAEAQLALWQAQQEIRLREMEIDKAHEANLRKVSLGAKSGDGISNTRFGGEVG